MKHYIRANRTCRFVFAEKVKDEADAMDDGNDEELTYFCKLVREIQKASSSLGREGRFQVFVCVSVR